MSREAADPADQALLTLLAEDLYQHFQKLVLRYQQRLYAFAMRLTGSAQDAEDILQEAFVSAYVSLENYPPQRVLALKLQPWLYRVTLNVYTHHVRGARLQEVSLDPSGEEPGQTIEDGDNGRPELLIEARERFQELAVLVSRLPERYRIAITCYYFEDLTYQEIAELLDQPVGTVKSSVSRGLRLLRRQLASSGLSRESARESGT